MKSLFIKHLLFTIGGSLFISTQVFLALYFEKSRKKDLYLAIISFVILIAIIVLKI